ncbi:ABC transporter ATP-binding protein [Microbacterium sp. 18062]|uniref:ABC transporter ATP-binding protein n=1 Tax=Microbacterium sp. 18062 TaxID=2681410 RepID=UPI001358D22E|nr:ABC transporter ATP-binding protein [Microbacterium sp. 18062]
MSDATDTPTGAFPVASGSRTWREVWRISRGRRLGLVAVAVLGVASAAIGLVAPAVIGSLVDRVQDGTAGPGTLVWATVAMVAAALAGAVGTALTVVLAGHSYHAMLAELRELLIHRAMALPQGVVERAGTGDLVSRSSDDVAQVADAAPQIIPAFTITGFTVAVTLVGMTVLDWRYGLALVVVLPVYVITLRWYLATAPRIYGAERAAMSVRAQQLLESQRGHATVLGFGLAGRRHQRVLRASWAVVTHSLRARTVQNMFFGRLNLAEYLGMAAILVTGFWLIGAGQSTVGAATTAMLLFLRLFGPINQLLFVVDVLQSVLASLNRMVGVIAIPTAAAGSGDADDAVDTAAETTNADGARDAAASPSVRLRGVGFGYGDGRPALDGIGLTILAGEHVAVVGASGAGKTTLAGVVAGIHEPHEGTVTSPRRTAVITQEMHVFAGTLRENLTLAAPDATDEAVRAALETTGAAGLVDLLPLGLDTPLGTAGHTLTAAQTQQVALARVVLADPELAIFDEATAEAGSTHAELLDRAASAALRGRTGLVIAHRLSQAMTCDRIVVMDRGRIIEDGTHASLVAAGGRYARLWAAWQGSPGR